MVSLKSASDAARLPARAAYGVRLAVALALVATILRLAGMHRTRRFLWRFARPAGERGVSEASARAFAARVDAVANRMPIRPRCLARSLLVAAFLRRWNMPAELVIGVLPGRSFAAHAWVERDGQPLNDTADIALRYRPIWRVRTLDA